MTLVSLGLAAVVAPAEGGVVIVKPEVATKSMEAAKAVDKYRAVNKAKEAAAEFARNTLEAAPGARTAQYLKVMAAQGESVKAADAAAVKTGEMMDDVAISGDEPTMTPPEVPDDLEAQAGELATKMGSGDIGCKCAAQLYGAAGTTADTKVTFAQTGAAPHQRHHKRRSLRKDCPC